MKLSKSEIICLIFVIIVASAIVFNNLGASTIHDWDEARRAQNAFEILKTNEWIVLHYGGTPDLWNLKPPLGTWLIAISFKIFGFNEFALRFWSALFGVLTVVIIYLFGLEIKNKYTGVFAALFLLTIPHFMEFHGARTGDLDSMVTFFIVLSLYLFYLSQNRNKPSLLVPTFIAIAIGFLIKGVIILVPLIIIIYLLCFKSFKKTLYNKKALRGIIAFFIITTPWFILRFIKGSKFFIKKIEYDMIKRFIEPIEGHGGGWINWFYYPFQIYRNLGLILSLLLIIAFCYSLYLFKRKSKPASLLIIWISVFIITMTLIQTKLFWYILPIYPALSLLIAYNISPSEKSTKTKKVMISLIFLLIIAVPLMSIIKMTQSTYVEEKLQSIKDLKPILEDYDKIYIHSEENRQSIFFYLSISVDNVEIYQNIEEFNPKKGSTVITFTLERFYFFNKNTDYQLIKEERGIAIFEKLED